MNLPKMEGPKAFVIGWPVKHSRSPMIHGFWLRELGIPGSYERAEIAPDAFAEFLGTLSKLGYAGGNVTVPYKEKAFALCSATSETAARLKAVNTLWIEGGKLYGDNTDVGGFLAALDHDVPDWDTNVKKALVLGAGGAARAIVQALILRNLDEIMIMNRTSSRIDELVNLFGPKVIPFQRGNSSALAVADLVINTTSLGMKDQPPLDFDVSGLPEKALVVDIIYVPLETELLRAARERGLKTVSGLSMLLHQAVPGFERWFGQRPVVTEALRQLIEMDVLGINPGKHPGQK